MSWKSFLSLGLICVLASPAFAVGPNMGIISTAGAQSSGHLNTAGNWVWTSQITPDLTIASGGATPVGSELGYTSSSTRSGDIAGQGNLISVANANPSVFDT